MKPKLKAKAIELRKLGLTYSQILEKIPVAKSTLSLWLREVGLSKPQKQKITEKRIQAGLRGARARKEQRIRKAEEIKKEAEKQVGKISKRELWLIGAMLYWAEGTKEKAHNTGSMVDFVNSDHRMVKLYIIWLTDIVGIAKDDIVFGIYIHQNSKERVDEVVSHWSKWTGFPKNRFTYIYFKKHNPKTRRKNIGKNYYGMLRVRVKRSIDLNRKFAGWVNGVCKSVE